MSEIWNFVWTNSLNFVLDKFHVDIEGGMLHYENLYKSWKVEI
jgi:hypothetical protein